MTNDMIISSMGSQLLFALGAPILKLLLLLLLLLCRFYRLRLPLRFVTVQLHPALLAKWT